jgi:hypothetical protein
VLRFSEENAFHDQVFQHFAAHSLTSSVASIDKATQAQQEFLVEKQG